MHLDVHEVAVVLIQLANTEAVEDISTQILMWSFIFSPILGFANFSVIRSSSCRRSSWSTVGMFLYWSLPSNSLIPNSISSRSSIHWIVMTSSSLPLNHLHSFIRYGQKHLLKAWLVLLSANPGLINVWERKSYDVKMDNPRCFNMLSTSLLMCSVHYRNHHSLFHLFILFHCRSRILRIQFHPNSQHGHLLACWIRYWSWWRVLVLKRSNHSLCLWWLNNLFYCSSFFSSPNPTLLFVVSSLNNFSIASWVVQLLLQT